MVAAAVHPDVSLHPERPCGLLVSESRSAGPGRAGVGVGVCGAP